MLQNLDSSHIVADLQKLIDSGGPKEDDYSWLLHIMDDLHSRMFEVVEGKSRQICDVPEVNDFMQANREIFCSTASMQGFVRVKPHGYAGDFEVIERIYNISTSAHPQIEKWDRFFHGASGARAVRNRARILEAELARSEPAALLSLGCGPALDVAPSLQRGTYLKHVTLLDNDAQALARAKANTQFMADPEIDLCFVMKNALRFRTEQRYDLIWSAGLFDYLADKTAIFLLARLRGLLAPGGRVVVGNFVDGNRSRPYMEVIGQWFLIHRTADGMRALATAAGFDPRTVEVYADDTGINLFLSAQAD